MSQVSLTLLAVPCLWFARWEQSADAFDMRCVRGLQRIPVGHQSQALAVEGGGLERSYCVKHLLEEEVSTGTGLIVHFWSVSWEWSFGQPPATCSTWQQMKHCSSWCAEQELHWFKLPTHILKGKRERKPLQLGWGQAAASSCLKAFLTAVKSVNHRIVNGALEKNLPWVFNAFQPQVSHLQQSGLLCSTLPQAFQLWELTEEKRGGEKNNQTFSIPSFPGATGLPLQNCYITVTAVASGIAITTYSVSSPGN